MGRIEAKELRIGNLVSQTIEHPTRNQEKVIKTEWQELMWISRDNSNSYKPIPLTEEWLLKFGFKEIKIDETFFWIKGKFIFEKSGVIGFSNFDFQGLCVDENRTKHVHQLQNLYFALTGEELTLKTD